MSLEKRAADYRADLKRVADRYRHYRRLQHITLVLDSIVAQIAKELCTGGDGSGQPSLEPVGEIDCGWCDGKGKCGQCDGSGKIQDFE